MKTRVGFFVDMMDEEMNSNWLLTSSGRMGLCRESVRIVNQKDNNEEVFYTISSLHRYEFGR